MVNPDWNFLCYIMDYSFLTMRIVFSGDRITGNCFRGVCKISREWRVTVEHVLRIATIYSSYTSIFLPSPSSYHPFLFYFLCYFWWHRGFLVAEAGCFGGLRSKCERGRGVWDSKVVFIPFIAFLSFSVAVSAGGKVRRMKGKRVSPAKENSHWNRKQTVLNPVS